MSSNQTPRPSAFTSPSPPNRGTALVVDDEPVVRQLATLMFRQLGFAVLPAQDGREAVSLLLQHRETIRVVVLDWTMPGPDGGQTLAAIRRLDAIVPVILCSGYSEESLADEIRGDRHTRFLAKPFSMHDLQKMVNESVGTAI